MWRFADDCFKSGFNVTFYTFCSHLIVENETSTDSTRNDKKMKKNKKKGAGQGKSVEIRKSESPTGTAQPDESTQLVEVDQKCQTQTTETVNNGPEPENNTNIPHSQLASCTVKKIKKIKKVKLRIEEMVNKVESECPLVLENSDKDMLKQDEGESRVVKKATITKKQKKSKKLKSSAEKQAECQDSCVDTHQTPAGEPNHLGAQESFSTLVNKKQSKSKSLVDLKVKESPIDLNSALSSKPIVADEPGFVNMFSELKSVKTVKKKKSISSMEPELEREEPKAAPTAQTPTLELPPCTPTPQKKKKMQKNLAKTCSQSLTNGVSQLSEPKESPVPKHTSAKKQKAATENSIAELQDRICHATVDCSQKKGKKKRKMLTEETGTAQMNGQTEKEIEVQTVRQSSWLIIYFLLSVCLSVIFDWLVLGCRGFHFCNT